ncbi:MAG: hypothetical protein GX348_03565 [Veillonellaceae bacterium]|nr:hypothetical protein [Veillonellaceae bacterium]
MKILRQLGFASEQEVLASEANSLKFLEQFNIWQARIVGFRNTAFDFAVQGTKNPQASEVVLGKYIPNSVESYEAIAASRGATYFQLNNWSRLATEFGEESMWLINRSFLQQQIANGKNIILTQNPTSATGYFAKEVNYLSELGYKFVQEGTVWRAIK